jgi:pyruvate/2-oxoglutarate dehydrogenase complex dihydrolipoamide dehydrogenase (E3) component
MNARTLVFDVIVIGAGPVGLTVAARAVRGGLTAVATEERLAGGECEYYACVPSKRLINAYADPPRTRGIRVETRRFR